MIRYRIDLTRAITEQRTVEITVSPEVAAFVDESSPIDRARWAQAQANAAPGRWTRPSSGRGFAITETVVRRLADAD